MEKRNNVIIRCEICNKDSKYFEKHLKNHHPEIKGASEYYLRYIDSSAGRCKTCKAPTSFIKIHKGFRNFCSDICGIKHPDTQGKRMKTLTHNLQERYGEDIVNIIQIPGVKERAKISYHRTVKEKYGEQYNYTTQVPSIIEKFKEIHANRTIEEKRNIVIKTSDTLKKKYNITSSEVINASQIPEIKIKEDEKYFIRLSQSFLDSKNYDLLISWELFRDIRMNQRVLNGKIDIFSKVYTIKCNIHNKVILVSQSQLNNLKSGTMVNLLCPQCSHNGSSLAEREVLEFVKSIYFGEVQNNSKQIIPPKELDIYIPEKKVAIEYHGLYYHSLRPENNISKKYHQEKYLACKEKGIHLIQIFEDEWRDKQDIVKSIIKNKLGITDTKLMARKLRVVDDLHKDVVVQFLNKNHLAGSGGKNYQKMFGLVDDKNNLVTVLTLRKPFTTKKDTIEIARFCSVLNTQVLGGFSKLLKRAKKWAEENNYHSILTYADLRLGSGDTYLNSGFIYDGMTNPNYFYVSNGIRDGRFKHRAQDGKSEKDRALELDIYPIYDCGSNIFSLTI